MVIIAKEIFNGSKPVTDKDLTILVGSLIESQVLNGFGRSFSEVDFTTPDGEMLQRITRDVWHFSAAKNYQHLRDLTLALKDETGKIRTFSQFREAAQKLNVTYNSNWLQTEYDMAIGSATMAARWADFKKNADDMPFLQYQTVGDNRVRNEHAILNGVVRKISDDFWSTHYPPNGWGCRCDVIQLTAKTATETDKIPSVPISPMFKTNLAKTGLIFPAEHPYYSGIPNDVIADALLYLPDDVVFKTVDTWETGKKLQLHIKHGLSEAKGNIEVARMMAKYYKYDRNIDLMPEIGGEIQLEKRKKIFGQDVFNGKCPDARISDAGLWDFKKFPLTHTESSTSKSFTAYYEYKLKHELNLKGKQASNIAISLKEEVDVNLLEKAVKGYLDQTKKQRTIIIFNGSADNVFEKTKR